MCDDDKQHHFTNAQNKIKKTVEALERESDSERLRAKDRVQVI